MKAQTSTLMRRAVLVGGLLLAALAASPSRADDQFRHFAGIEARAGGRLGVMIEDTGTGRAWTYRADERFPMDSTFKAFACAALLAQVDRGTSRLDRRVTYAATDLVPHSPRTEQHVADGMTLGELCAAATATSDNTAANLILAEIGGPEGLTRFMREIGDDQTRLDRWEPALNDTVPGDPRDTTTPRAAARSLAALLLGDALSPASRAQLTAWLEGNLVAGPLLRAAVPDDWRIADRTGADDAGSRGIIALVWPPDRPPLRVAIYLAHTDLPLAARNGVIAEIGRLLVSSRP